MEVHEENMTANTNSTWNRLVKLFCQKRQKSFNEETSHEKVYEANPNEIETSKVLDDWNPDG